MTNIGGIDSGNGENRQRAVAASAQAQEQQNANEKAGRSGLTWLVTFVSYIAYTVILCVSPNADISRKLLAGVLFVVTAPFCIGAGGFIGSLITPSFVITSDAWGLLKARLFWWVGPRFIGALVAAFIATMIGAPTLLSKVA